MHISYLTTLVIMIDPGGECVLSLCAKRWPYNRKQCVWLIENYNVTSQNIERSRRLIIKWLYTNTPVRIFVADCGARACQRAKLKSRWLFINRRPTALSLHRFFPNFFVKQSNFIYLPFLTVSRLFDVSKVIEWDCNVTFGLRSVWKYFSVIFQPSLPHLMFNECNGEG